VFISPGKGIKIVEMLVNIYKRYCFVSHCLLCLQWLHTMLRLRWCIIVWFSVCYVKI